MQNEQHKKKECVCKNVGCPNHGNCKECREKHKESLTSCQKLKQQQ